MLFQFISYREIQKNIYRSRMVYDLYDVEYFLLKKYKIAVVVLFEVQKEIINQKN